jgi:hypothetical protein
MPTRTGIFWNVQKDMTVFDALLRSEQKVILAIDNIYDSVFTAAWNVTITALYYKDAYNGGALTPAATILPLSSRSSANNASSVFTLPDDNATVSYALPRNAARAVVQVIASGNSNEEFWYRSVPSQFTKTFANATLRAHSPFREVQVLIDGTLAGVAWPFPIVYTGGINPALWVPVVGIAAYDVPAYQIDVTPWLGLLCDGAEHTFALRMVGYETGSDDGLGTVNENWLVSGAVWVWLDEKGNQTTGTLMVSSTQNPVFALGNNVTNSGGTNTSLAFTLTGQRTLSHSSTITTSSGSRPYTWSQNLAYSNSQFWTGVTAYTSNSTVYQVTTGSSSFSTGGSTGADPTVITNTFQYPISVVQKVSYPVDDQVANSSLYGALDRYLISSTIPILEFLTYPSGFAASRKTLTTRQAGYATEYWNNTYYEQAGAIDPAEGSIGQTEQWYSYSGPISDGSSAIVSYGRYVKALDGYEPELLVNETYDSASAIAVPATVQLSL